jgi:osmoprotectant transport system substrate-binding protein
MRRAAMERTSADPQREEPELKPATVRPEDRITLMTKTRRRTVYAVIAGSLLLAGAGGCGRKRAIVVGSRNGTEQVILGEILAQHLEARTGARVERRLDLGGMLLVHEALVVDQIDVYPEYTGTGLVNILKEQPVGGRDAVLNRVRQVYSERWHVEWMDPLGFDNPFVVAIRSEEANRLKISKLREAEGTERSWTLGEGLEFARRPDGMAALSSTYDLNLSGGVKTMDPGQLYTALGQGKITMAAGNMTDGALAKPEFTVLEDDRHVFGPYQACYIVQSDLFGRWPEARKAIGELSGKIDVAAMRRMNMMVESEHRPVGEVAAGFLRTLKF